ncbi:MAG: GNAT family N-acetyltransferase [Dehalococcoidia bacterium]
MLPGSIAVTIRPYQPADQAQIEWLYARTPPAGQVAWRPLSVPADLRHIPDTFARLWVATEPIPEGEAIVGMAAVADASRTLGPPVPEFLATTKPTARLHHVAVAPERWRQGIGRRLTLTAVDWARRQGYRAVILDTTPQQAAAVALYEATGFADAGRSMVDVYELVWFRLTL